LEDYLHTQTIVRIDVIKTEKCPKMVKYSQSQFFCFGVVKIDFVGISAVFK